MISLSIVTVNYNSGDEINKTINSLSSFLELDDVEFIVIDGGSTDVSFDFLRNSSLVDVFVSEPDKGIYDAMNKGIQLAQGDWVWFVNSGDKVVVSADQLLKFVKNTSQRTNLLYSDLLLSNGRVIIQDFNLLKFIRTMLNHQNIIYRKSLISPGYDITYKLCADFAHLMTHYPTILPEKLPHLLCVYDVNGVSSGLSRKIRSQIWLERLRAIRKSNTSFIFKSVALSIAILILMIKKISPSIGSVIK